MAYQLLYVAPALCQNWYLPSSGCFAPCKRIPVVGTSRNLAPLNPAHFQNSRNQRTARCNGLFSRVLLTSRSRFLYKILALAEMVEELAQNYASAVVTLGEGLTPPAGAFLGHSGRLTMT